MPLQIIQGQTGYINPGVSILSTGWSISGIYATHESCNNGYITSLTSLGLVIGRQYNITYTVDNYKNGSVNLVLGANNGTSRTANGTYSETLTCTTTAQMRFFSDGSLRISVLKFYDTVIGFQTGTTVSFNEGENKWGAEYSFKGEQIIKFIDGLFTLKNGQLYEHNTNPIRNNFYGEQFSSQLTIIANKDYFKEKMWFNMRLDSKGNWYAPVLTTPVSNQFPNGMISRLKKNNFSLVSGKLWASILRDYSDPNFAASTQVQALFNARMMQGAWLIIEMQNDDTTEARIASIEIYYSDTERAL